MKALLFFSPDDGIVVMMSSEARVSRLEQALIDLAEAQARTEHTLQRRSEETARNIERHSEETARNLDRLSEETTRKFNRLSEETARNLDRRSEETTRNLDRLSAEMREFKDEMRAFKSEMGRKWGELANKMGTLVEDIVAPSIPDVFAQFFSLEQLLFTAPRVRRWLPGDHARMREFDYLAISDHLVLVNETKSTLRPEDIPACLARLTDVRAFLPEAEGRELVGSLAALQIDPSLVTAGEREGLLMFGLGGGLLDVLNSPGFTPRRF